MHDIYNKMAAEMFPKNAESFQNGGTYLYQEWQFSAVYKLIFWRHTFSRPVLSTTQPPLRQIYLYI